MLERPMAAIFSVWTDRGHGPLQQQVT